MIKSVHIKNFKSIKDETYEFGNFDLIVGRNNNGKSTVLQALAIWQYCIDEFRRKPKGKGDTGMQIILPEFVALPVPEFLLLWHQQFDRKNIAIANTKKFKPELIFIEINITWTDKEQNEYQLGVKLRYASKQTIFASSTLLWADFNDLAKRNVLPTILYVPPFSGLEEKERRFDVSVIKEFVGKFQPGSVLRNLLLRVYLEITTEAENIVYTNATTKPSKNWEELHKKIKKLFGVDLKKPEYKESSTTITCEYLQYGTKPYDLIAGGSGFHQTLILLSFLFGFEPDMVLFDEPDAHLHVNLQREILDYLQKIAKEKDIQFVIATHAEEFINKVNASQIISLLQGGKPKRIQNTNTILKALSEVQNIEVTCLENSPFILYIEGEDDGRLLQKWASTLGKETIFNKFYPKIMSGGNKNTMKEIADTHFKALREINPKVRQVVVFDRDDENTFHPPSNSPVFYEWKRRNIDNYLLVSDTWKRAIKDKLQHTSHKHQVTEDLSLEPYHKIIDEFFAKERLELRKNENWKTVDAEIFATIDGKKILFEKSNCLFTQLRNFDNNIVINKETLSSNMLVEEIHEDIVALFDKLENIINS
jgi:AAA15 family ATPase/GTPase